MKVAPLLGAALVIYVAIPGSNQEKGKPKFCKGADGNRYKKGEIYEDKENCIRYTCTKIQNKLKMKKENIIPCTGDISTIVEISQKIKRTITDTNLNTVIHFNVHNAMGSDCYSKYSKIYPYPAAKGKSLSECQTICTNNPECGAILMLKASIESGGSTSCYMIKPNNLFNEGTCTWGSGTYNAYEKKFTVFIYKVYKAMESSCYSKYTKISPYPAASSISLSECQTICSYEPKCGAIVMLKSSVESGGTTFCYMIKPNNLFNQGTCTWGNGNYNAYEKKVTGCVKDDNIDYHGNDIPDKNEIVNGLEGCIKWCGDTTACKYWTFEKSNQRCWLKTSDSGKRENSDRISGTKNCETVCTADAITEAACFCKSATGGAGEACTPEQKCNGDGTCQDESEPDLAANVTAIEASMQFLNDSLESIERKFEALQNNMQFLNDSMESIERKFEALQNSMESILEVIKATQSTSKNLESCLADISSSECPSPASGKTSMAREISDNTAALDDKCDATTCSFIQETVQELQQKFNLGSYETKMLIQLDTSTAFETAKLSSLEKENCTEEMKVTMKKYKETEDIIKKLRFKKPFIRSTELTDRLGYDSRLFTALKQTITRVSREWTSLEAAERLIQFMSENFQKWAKKGGGLSILETRPGSEVSGDGDLVCSNFLQYRRIDGKCNNLNITDQGSAGIAMRRFMPNKYEDGVSTPRGGLTNSSLPSARVVSRKIHHARNPNPLTSKGYTLMAMQFGQFLDHDVTLTTDMEMDCCDPEILSNDSSVCFNIDITGDDFYSGKTTCHSFTRSVEIVSDTDVREQINGITAYIDASNVYGSDDDLAKNLRTLVNGKLKTHADGPMLPTRRQVNLESKGPAHLDEDLVAGDMRVMEQPTLASIHSLFLNEHNRIADELRSRLSNFLSNKKLSEQDEIIYQESRKLVGAEMQNIVYTEFLPIVLGQEELTKHNLQLSAVTTYDDQIDPSIRNEFATVAFRFGHSLIAGMFNGNGGHRLKLTYFDESPEFVSGRSPNNNGRAWYSELTETSKQTSPADDVFCTEDVTNFLFSNTRGGATNFGEDLPARNIQRGRDHGLPPYNEFRTFCGLSPLEDFHNKPDEITAENWAKLKNTYNRVNDIDAWTGGLAETAPSDGLVGPTFACIIGKQFNVLKFGDRFFFNNDNGNGLKIKSRETIVKRNLGDIICDNTDTTILQRYVMIEEDASSNPQQKCSSRNPLDFDAIAIDISGKERKPTVESSTDYAHEYRGSLLLENACEGRNPSNYWLSPHGKTGEEAYIILNLGRVTKFNRFNIKNTHNGHSNDRGAENVGLYTSNSKDGPWNLVAEKLITDARNKGCNVPLEEVTIATTNSQFIKLVINSYYGLGGGLKYLGVDLVPDSCPIGWTNFQTGCYNFVEAKIFDEAVVKCKEIGGYLSEIRNQNEQNNFRQFAENSGYRRKNIWLGAKRGQNDKWVWINSGEEMTYDNWHRGNPDNHGGNENCLSAWGSDGSSFQWNDQPCDLPCDLALCQQSGERFGYGFLYLAILIYLFACIAFISESMMSRFRKVTVSWNKTVATFTLLSFGITAPQMLLAFFENLGNKFNAGDLGPFSIIGSAAFRYLVIIGYFMFFCTFVTPNGRINNMFVFLMSSLISVGSFIWLYLIVGQISEGEIKIMEVSLLMAPYPFVVGILFAFDFLDLKCKINGSNSTNAPIPLQEGQAGTDVGVGALQGGEDGTATSKEQDIDAKYEEQPKSYKNEFNTNNRENTWKVFRLITMPWLFIFDLLSKLSNAVDLVLAFILAYFILMPIFIVLVMDLTSHLGCFIFLKEAGSGILLITLGFCIPSAISARNAIKTGSTVDNIVAQMIGSNIMSVLLGLGLPWLISASYHHQAGYFFLIPPGSLKLFILQLLGNTLICTLILVIGSLVPETCMCCCTKCKCSGQKKLQDNKIWRIIWGILFALSWLSMVLLSFFELYGII